MRLALERSSCESGRSRAPAFALLPGLARRKTGLAFAVTGAVATSAMSATGGGLGDPPGSAACSGGAGLPECAP
jgi:hypothetical protein